MSWSEREAAKKDVEVLIKLADAVRDRAHPMPTLSNWQAVQASLVTLRHAFGPPI